MALRRRAVESLGLLARRSSDRDQRQRIAAELEGWLRSDALHLLVVDAEGWRWTASPRTRAGNGCSGRIVGSRSSGRSWAAAVRLPSWRCRAKMN